MDDQRVGRVVRALRRRRGWRQLDLAQAAGCSQGMVSLIERGHIDTGSLRLLRNVLAALDARVSVQLSWRAGELDRLLDEDSVVVAAAVTSRLRAAGWLVETEVTYAHYGERGSYDLLAFSPATAIVLAIEVKTDLPSVEATLRKLDEKARLAPTIARDRFGWRSRTASRMLVMPDVRTLRRRVERHRELLDGAFPLRSVAARQWVAKPFGAVSALWFLTVTNAGSSVPRPGVRSRVRVARKPSASNAGAA
ncbi:MAG TPA: XRE family transcriptional regulator [Candidatus Limnocylindria bacterium]|nr:XRE family transcriptional regulator [Candidatus Limnocylindria bacterium]